MVFKLLGWEWELQLNGYIFAGGKTHLHLNAALVHMCTSKSCTEHKNSKIELKRLSIYIMLTFMSPKFNLDLVLLTKAISLKCRMVAFLERGGGVMPEKV